MRYHDAVPQPGIRLLLRRLRKCFYCLFSLESPCSFMLSWMPPGGCLGRGMPSSYSHEGLLLAGEGWALVQWWIPPYKSLKRKRRRARLWERERENHTAILKHVSGGGFRIVISPLNLLTSPCAYNTMAFSTVYERISERAWKGIKWWCAYERERQRDVCDVVYRDQVWNEHNMVFANRKWEGNHVPPKADAKILTKCTVNNAQRADGEAP